MTFLQTSFGWSVHQVASTGRARVRARVACLIVALSAQAAAQAPTGSSVPPAAAADGAATPASADSTSAPANEPTPAAAAEATDAPAEPSTKADEPPSDDNDRVVPRSAPAKAEEAPEKLLVGTLVGKVVERKDGALVLESEFTGRLERGMRVSFNDERGDEFAVGKINKVNNNTFHVAVGMNEEVPVGTVGYLSNHTATGSLEAPPAGAYPLSAALVLRPWLGLNGAESGVLVDAFVRIRLGAKAKLTIATEPSIPAFGSVAPVIEAYVAPSISMRLAEIGFGIGMGTALGEQSTAPQLGVLFTPILRLGSEDGLFLRMRTSAVLASGIASFGSFRAEGQIPLTYGLWLLLGGGGGQRSYAFGDVGIRMLMSGTGSRQSWFAKVLIGAAGGVAPQIVGGLYQRTSEAGPTFGIGVEARL